MTACAIDLLKNKYGAEPCGLNAEDNGRQATDDPRVADGQGEGGGHEIGRADDLQGAGDDEIHWKDSAAVVALKRYLGEHSELGAEVGMVQGGIALHFAPPLDRKQADRWRAAGEALDLFIDAIEDMRFLMACGAMRLRVIDGRTLEHQ